MGGTLAGRRAAGRAGLCAVSGIRRHSGENRASPGSRGPTRPQVARPATPADGVRLRRPEVGSCRRRGLRAQGRRPHPAPRIFGDPRRRGEDKPKEMDCDRRDSQRSLLPGPRVPPPGSGCPPASGWEPGSPKEALDSQDPPLSSSQFLIALWASLDQLKGPAGPDPAHPREAGARGRPLVTLPRRRGALRPKASPW